MCVWFSFSPLKAKEISKDFKAIGFLEEEGLFLKKTVDECVEKYVIVICLYTSYNR